jgi:CTP synthase
MQIAVIEFARNLAGLENANSTEFDMSTPHPVIYLMEEWFDDKSGTVQRRDVHSDKGGTMRLGAYPCKLNEGSVAYRAYGLESISERHRHRYEFNNEYMAPLKEAGLKISGMAPSGELVEIVEIEDHPWYLGCQFHPEFKSRPMTPHPLFRSFIAAALKYSGNRKIADQ